MMITDDATMPTLTLKQAAHRIRMSVKLLKWFASYAVLGKKLLIVDGMIDEADLSAFDQLLWGPWRDRSVPEGISHELKREARGRCTICGDVGPLEEVHIKRRKKELDHYCQHPHNLTLGCPTCHTRYDSGDPSLPMDVIATCKEEAQQHHMREVDADIAMTEAVAKIVAPHAAKLREAGRSFWAESIGAQAVRDFSAIVAPVTGSAAAPATSKTAIDRLGFMSGSLASDYPLTAATFESLIEGETDQGVVWQKLDADETEPWMCMYGDEIALVENAICPKCDEIDYSKHNEPTQSVERDKDGLGVIAHFEDAQGRSYTPSCKKCGRSPLHYEFQRLCGYHEHMEHRMREDD